MACTECFGASRGERTQLSVRLHRNRVKHERGFCLVELARHRTKHVQIKALEAYLGANLFDRLYRSVRLTSAGERLAAATQQAYKEIGRTLDELKSDGLTAGPSTLSISATSSFAAMWLASRIHLFQALHPEIELRLAAENAVVDLAHDVSVDIALRYGPGPYSEALEAEKLWPSGDVFPVCAPSLAASGNLGPGALVHHALLRTAPPVGADIAGRPDWLAWLAAARMTGVVATRVLERGPLFDSTQLAIEAAMAGRGVALAPAVLVQDAIRAGRLAKPFAISIPDPFSYWIVCRKDRMKEAPIGAFHRWIALEAKRTNAELLPSNAG
ncbi:LysR substrate-binding domain-containing protein [Agrilutibacter niabensis]